jgi:hypothetical protein
MRQHVSDMFPYHVVMVLDHFDQVDSHRSQHKDYQAYKMKQKQMIPRHYLRNIHLEKEKFYFAVKKKIENEPSPRTQ